jgi:hypothetical protein
MSYGLNSAAFGPGKENLHYAGSDAGCESESAPPLAPDTCTWPYCTRSFAAFRVTKGTKFSAKTALNFRRSRLSRPRSGWRRNALPDHLQPVQKKTPQPLPLPISPLPNGPTSSPVTLSWPVRLSTASCIAPPSRKNPAAIAKGEPCEKIPLFKPKINQRGCFKQLAHFRTSS